jgi:peroxiredoxin
LRHDYPKIRKAGAELVILSPDTSEEHRRYGRERFGEELPWLFISDPRWEIGRRYGVLRSEEHPHGGFWSRSLWVLDRTATITARLLPWNVSTAGNRQVTAEQIAEYEKLCALVGAEPCEYQAACGVSVKGSP